MFTLSGLILEARENLFRDFWSPFSISYYFSSERKKAEPTTGRNRPELCRSGGFISHASGPSHPTSSRRPNPNPSRQLPPPPAADPPEPRVARGSPPLEICAV